MFIGGIKTDPRLASVVAWAAVIGYLTSAALSAWLAVRCGSSGRINERRGWWFVCIFMTALGINKQLNLQTFLLETGRIVAKSGHWYGYRRYAQVCFVFALLLVAVVVGWKMAPYYRPMVEQRIEIVIGVFLLASYCILRASEIDHLKPVAVVHTRYAHSSFWLVEIAGIVMVLFGTVRAALAQTRPRRSST